MAPEPNNREANNEKRVHFSVYSLVPDQVEAFEREVLHENAEIILLNEPLNGVFVPVEPEGHEPSWVSSIRAITETAITADMESSSPGGFLVVWHAEQTFVLTFGHAWQQLKAEWLVRDFGRRIALNAVPPDAVIWMKSEQFLAKWHLASERAPRASSVDEFGVDFDRDLVGAVEGVPTLRNSLGGKVRGGTSLHVNLPISSLMTLLDDCAELFASDAYRTTWPDIDNIRRIEDEPSIIQLDASLDLAMSNGEGVQRITMFTPFQRKGEALLAESYVFGRFYPTAPRIPYLTFQLWANFLIRTGLLPSVAQSKAVTVHILDEHDEAVRDFRVYDCLGFEAALGARVCILSSGIWYEVLEDFVRRVAVELNDIPRSILVLPAWNEQGGEDEYNALCANDPAFLNCHRQIFRFGGGQAQFEFCDLVNHQARTLLFVKKGSKSSGMSHLFEQVRRTIEILFSVDNGGRERIIESLRQRHPLADLDWLQSRPRQGDWTICLVSLGESAVTLPFFAKCGLTKLHKELVKQGHLVSFIDV